MNWKRLIGLFVLSLLVGAASATTWTIRHDGGDRYSTNKTAGLCDGQADATPVGTTPNQHCAFNDVRYLWADFSYNASQTFPGWGWVIAGGDTVIIKDCIQYAAHAIVGTPGSNGPCRIGPNGDGTQPNDPVGGIFGNTGASGAPPPPAGTAGAHTRILGANWASCGSVGAMAHTQGGFGIGSAWAFSGTNYVDFQCVDVTDGSNCNRASSLTTAPCSTSAPFSDYANNGVSFYSTTTNVTVKDVYAHGLAHDCFAGPTGDGTVTTNIILSGCPDSTWNMDPGDGTTGTGHLTLNNVHAAFAGFEEVYPINHANDITFPWGTVGQVGDGTDQSHGGYGDCIGTATTLSSPAWIMAVNGGGCVYATQDGHDLLHLQGNGSTITINGALNYGNMGQQMKLGAAGSLINNQIVGNCNALRTLPGLAPNAVNQLSDYCRAGDAAIVMSVSDNTASTFAFNTVFTASLIAMEVSTNGPCDNSTCILNVKDNVLSGYANTVANGYSVAAARGTLPNPIYFDAGNPFSFGASSYDHNVTFNQLAGTPCPNTGVGETNATCTSPQLTDMAWYLFGYGNMAPASGASAVVGHGIAISGITTDFNGVTRPNPPSMGAIDYLTGVTQRVVGIILRGKLTHR